MNDWAHYLDPERDQITVTAAVTDSPDVIGARRSFGARKAPRVPPGIWPARATRGLLTGAQARGAPSPRPAKPA